MIKKLPKEFLDVVSENNGLKQYLSNLSVGREFTPRSWLYENQDPNTILKNWLNILSRLQNGNLFEKNVYQFDTSQLEKWGPQGGIAPIKELMEGVVLPTFKEYSPVPAAYDSSEWTRAVNLCIEKMRQRSVWMLRPTSYARVVDDMRARDTLESNSGWPLFTRRNKPEVISDSIRDAENGSSYGYPAVALFRNYNQKTRLVWMFPMSQNLIEGSYFQPLQSAIIKSRAEFYAPWIGFEEVRRLITKAYDSGKFISASDFSSTDEHFQWWSTNAISTVPTRCFQRAFQQGLLESLQRMHTIPLVISESSMVVGDHGVSSGSNWTNFIETIFDEVLSEYVHLKYANTRGFYAIGDDMAWISDTFDEDLEHKLEQCGKDVGQLIKADKTTNKPNEVKTLQRLFQRGYRRQDGLLRGVYSTIRALKSSVYPERFHKPSSWNSDMFCARQYMILENCVDHPLFEEFVKFVVNGHRDLIPFARKSKTELDRIQRETHTLPGFNPTYNQEKRDTSLANFESVKLAKSF
nr:MAG: RNA-dependent RNA-polymerase [Picobirnavirus sp.]